MHVHPQPRRRTLASAQQNYRQHGTDKPCHAQEHPRAHPGTSDKSAKTRSRVRQGNRGPPVNDDSARGTDHSRSEDHTRITQLATAGGPEQAAEEHGTPEGDEVARPVRPRPPRRPRMRRRRRLTKGSQMAVMATPASRSSPPVPTTTVYKAPPTKH